MPYLAQMLPFQLKKAKNENKILLLPIGCIEFHGNHLPFGTDMYIAEKVAEEIEKRIDVVVAPSINYAPTGYAVSGAEDGTVDVDTNCFKNYCREVLSSFICGGFKKIIVLLHHQGKDGVCGAAVKMAAAELFNTIYKSEGGGWWTKQYQDGVPFSIYLENATLDMHFFPGHGGKGETNAMLAICPELVDSTKAVENDFPWNWNNENRVADANKENADTLFETLIIKWIEKIKSL